LHVCIAGHAVTSNTHTTRLATTTYVLCKLPQRLVLRTTRIFIVRFWVFNFLADAWHFLTSCWHRFFRTMYRQAKWTRCVASLIHRILLRTSPTSKLAQCSPHPKKETPIGLMSSSLDPAGRGQARQIPSWTMPSQGCKIDAIANHSARVELTEQQSVTLTFSNRDKAFRQFFAPSVMTADTCPHLCICFLSKSLNISASFLSHPALTSSK
jgi:hypothetical protein